MKKKFLALVLTLAMVLSLVPVTALATGATQPNIQNSGPVTSNDGYVDLEKTAAAVERSDNTFEITLKATVRNGKQEGTKTSTDAVLVIDRSASMEDGRINSAQEAAKQFAEVVLGNGANKENQIAVVSYAKRATTDTELSSDLDKVKRAIDFEADGGTNIQAGIKAARDILQSSTADNKVILVLSDGEPTYSFRAVGTATQTGCTYWGIHYTWDAEIDSTSVNITGFDYDSIAGSGVDYQYDYTWRDGAKLQVTCEHNKTESRSYPFYQNNGQPTIQEASYAKKDGCEIYSIYLGKPTDTNAVSTMTKIATDNDHYKLATDASELGELFKGIAKDITLPVTPGIVTDPMGDHMKLVADSLQGNSAVSINNNNSGFTWDLTQVTPVSNTDGSRTYELKYQITFDTNFDGFNAGTFYPTNQETTLSYTVQGDQKTASFPIPKVKGTAATYQLTYDANGGNQDSVPTDSTAYTKNARANLNYDNDKKPTHDNENGKNVIFIGWSETKDNTIYDNGSTIDTSSLIKSIQMDGNKTVYAVWGYDAIGKDNKPDGVPDVFNAVVTYNIVGGKWVDGTDNGTAEKQEVIQVKKLKGGVWTDTDNTLTDIPNTDNPNTDNVIPNEGYTKTGTWSNPAPTTGTVVKANTIYTYTLKAVPPAPTYTLTYDANGGQFSSGETTSETKQETIATTGNHPLKYTGEYTPTYTSEGKKIIFLGWSTTKQDLLTNNAPNIITNVDIQDSTTTVYAVWSLDENNNDIPDVFEATIIYKIENGQWTDGVNAIGSADITATFQLYVQQSDHTWKATDKLLRYGNFPAGYTGKEGHTGLGWYRNSETTPSELVLPTTKVIDAVTGAVTVFTYKYVPTTSKTYTVVLHLEGGSYTTTPDRYTANSDGIYQYSVTEPSAVINPESPSRNNFGFEGWSLSKNAPQTLIAKDATFASLYLEQSGTSGSFDKINLYAVWKESEPSVTVNKKVETVGGKTFERDKTVARQNDKIVWSVTVTNEKDTPAQVTLTDVMAAGVYTDVGCQTEASAVNWNATAHSWTATVSPKGSSIYYVCYTVTQDDIPNGKIVNTIVKDGESNKPIESDPVSTWDTKQLKSATSLDTSDWTTTVKLTLPMVNVNKTETTAATDTVNQTEATPIIAISKNSYVIDQIGNEFTFVPELTLNVGDKTYTGQKDGDTNTYKFATKDGETYPDTVTYTDTPAQFTWNINEDVYAGTKVTLSYKLKLTAPKTAAGAYGVTDLDGNGFVDGAETTKVVAADALYTNEKAALYIKENDQGKEIAVFPKPSVSYTIKGSSGGHGGNGGGTVTIPDDVPTGLNGKDHYAYVVGYPDGMVYPQKNITRAEVATIFFRLLKDETREANMTKSNGYNDMKDGAWYTCAVSTLSKMGIIKGYEDGSFKPDASISRAEFAAIAARFDPDGDKTPATFSDVSSHWAKDEISIAANHGWIKGYEDGSFKPDQKITRAETMTLVNRVLKRLPETKDDLHKDMKTWPDNQNESAWFYLAVQEATNSHYQKLKKDGTHETWESMRETRDWAALEK